MQLDERSNKIFKELLNNPSIHSNDLEKKYGLTRRQFGYSVKKINEWLIKKNLPEIERTRDGHFVIDSTIFPKFEMEIEAIPVDMNILTEIQRMNIIVLMLLTTEELSLYHFTSEMDVSKNTILSDIKKAKDFVAGYNLSIRYSRRDGYLIEGNEFQTRKLLIHVIYKILDMNNGKERILKIADIQEDEINELNGRINRVESKLNLKFTDEKILAMPYTLFLVLRRIEKGYQINSFYIKYEELSDTKEYLATEEILYDLTDISMQERLFITLFLLTTNVYWSEFLTEEAIPNLIHALDDMLRLFESRACISLQDRGQLLNKLLLHVKPAYFRIKYHLTEVNDIQLTVSEEFKELHHLVKQSTGPLSEFIGLKIPESETTYFTMLIGGWLSKQGDSIQEKVKALVVCPQGVSVSKFLFGELRELFPEFVFLDSLSVREFNDYSLDYDIVFSPISLDAKKTLYMVNSFLKREEKIRLRRQVMLDLHGYAQNEFDIEAILNIIERYAVIENRKSLSAELQHYFKQDITENSVHIDYPNPNLNELIKPETITLKKSVRSWEEAIKTASEPLVDNGSITNNYVKAIIKSNSDPYIVISPNTAIPHASPDEGVNKLSMSLLRLEDGVEFAGTSINLVIIVAAVDKEKHIKALTQLINIAGNEDARDLIIKSNSKMEIDEIISLKIQK